MAFGYEAFDDLEFVDDALDEMFDRGGETVMFRLEDSSNLEKHSHRDGIDLIYNLAAHPSVDENRLPGGRLPAELDIDGDIGVAEPLGTESYRMNLSDIEDAAYLCENYPLEAIEASRPFPEN